MHYGSPQEETHSLAENFVKCGASVAESAHMRAPAGRINNILIRAILVADCYADDFMPPLFADLTMLSAAL